MPASSLLLTAIPHGVDADDPLVDNGGGDTMRVLVHLAPRLRTPGTLADHPHWVDWPATLAGVSWTVRFPDLGVPDIPATPVGTAAESARWTAVLPPDTPVDAHAYQGFDHRPLVSYQSTAIIEFLADRWGRVGAISPTDHPYFADLVGDDDGFGAIGFEALWARPTTEETGPQRRARLRAEIAAEINTASDSPADWATPAAGPLPADPEARRDELGRRFLRLARFHNRDRIGVHENDAMPEEPFLPDVHRVLAAVRRHPTLERLLGTVVELVFPAPGATSTSTAVQVLATLPAGIDVVSARTMCTVQPQAFRAVSATPGQTDLVDGYLALGDPSRFAVVTIDPDGGGLKALQFADNLARSRVLVGPDTYEPFSAATPEAYALPSQSSAGLAVVRPGRAQGMAAKLAAVTAINAAAFTGDGTPAGEPTLWAEDLVRGHRFDIRLGGESAWRSLQAQAGSYWFLTGGGPQELPGIEEEAVVVAGATSAGGATPPPDLYLQESLMRWGGWSLAARLPGTSLGPADEVGADPDATQPDPALRFRAALGVAPGSLPRLRYGQSYHVRARAVDLAGSSAALDDDNPAVAESPPVHYLRFDPVPSPVTVLAHPAVVPGEKAETLVVRTDTSAGPAGDDTVTETRRHVVPPRGSVAQAEHHGMFDLADQPGRPLDPGAHAAYASRDAEDLATHPDGVADPDDPQRSKYFPVPHLTIQHLSDPLARAATVRGLPEGSGGTGTRTVVPFAVDDWPNWDSFGLRVTGGPASSWSFDPVQRMLDLIVAPAEDLDLRLSSKPEDDQVSLMGVLSWIRAWREANPSHPSVAGTTMEALVAEAAAGHHWMCTPWRTIRVVHAVRRPLADPDMPEGQLSIARDHGDTHATVQCRPMLLHRRSTSKVDIEATWSEHVDRGPGGPDPTQSTSVRSVPISITIDPRSGEDDEEFVSERHEFGDTRHRLVTYQAVATSAFVEHFRDATAVVVPESAPAQVDARGLVASTVVVTGDDGTELRQGTDGDYTVDEAAGTISRVPTGTLAAGATVDVGFVVPAITTASVPRTRVVPSSARPAAPLLEYVVPTFAHEVGDGGARTRSGRGLRVYLRRPWWSSGDGEQLAVVLWPGAAGGGPLPEDLESHVTQWGFDPVSAWSTSSNPPAPMPPHPTPAHFALSTGTVEGLSLPGAPGTTVDIAPHDVVYDPQRDLWSADITVGFGHGDRTYWPFLRLALARYQPHSLAGVSLSRVVLTDFVQVAPDRTVTVASNRQGHRVVTVTGRTHARNGAVAGPPTVRVTIEATEPDVDDPDLRWQRLVTRAGVPNPVVLQASLQDGNHATWSGEVVVPPTQGPTRLVIEEVERHATTSASSFVPRDTAERVVFLDTIDL